MTVKIARLTFWRLVLAFTAILAGLSIWDVVALAGKLGFSPWANKTWLLMLGLLALTCLASLVLFIVGFWQGEKLSGGLEFVDRLPNLFPNARPGIILVGGILFSCAVIAYPLIMFLPYYGNLLTKPDWIKIFLFWVFALAGSQGIKLIFPRLKGLEALLITLLVQACLQRVALYLPDISSYPFAMGWSETSRFYYPALFLSKQVFGQALSWPILHPTLHFVLTAPYLVDAPLWFHRFWQVAVRFLLAGLIGPALIYRLNIAGRRLRWLTGLWIFLMIFSLPLYLHLAVPVFLILWGFSADNQRRTWIWLVLASIWAGLSRINWYPMPGMLAAALYFLEVPNEKNNWRYFVKPALWFLGGTIIAILSMQVYISLSGITNVSDFFTSLNSTKLWDRLWPNESYSLGVLPGILLYSIPPALVIFSVLRGSSNEVFPDKRRLFFLFAELTILFLGGLVVSTKIGGGADIHNMDAYAVLLLVVTASLLFGARQGHGAGTQTSSLHWGVIALLIFVPAWFSIQNRASFWDYNPAEARATLQALQQKVNQVDAAGGQMLFITQRHLISMHMLTGVTLVQDYEREELMEMAMAQNDAYLKKFRSDLENHRFAAIVVDPLRYNLESDQAAMGAENNAWTRAIVKKILCNYRQEIFFPIDHIAIYVPQTGEQKCPN